MENKDTFYILSTWIYFTYARALTFWTLNTL